VEVSFTECCFMMGSTTDGVQVVGGVGSICVVHAGMSESRWR